MLNTRTIWALLLVSGALAAVAYGVIRTVRKDRAVLFERFGVERLGQVQKVAHEIQTEFKDVGEDLRLVGQLVHGTNSVTERVRTLRALLAVVRPYRLVAVYDAEGRRVESVVEPGASPSFSESDFYEVLESTARKAIKRDLGEIETSLPISADRTGGLRAFATPLPKTTHGKSKGAIVVLVDTSSFFGKLKLIAGEQGARQIVLGTSGLPVSATDKVLIGAVAQEASSPANYPTFGNLLTAMRSGAEGSSVIEDIEAQKLGLGSADVVAAYVPIHIDGVGGWSLATLSSTVALRSQERAMMARLAAVSAAIAMCLLGFAAYVVVMARRAVAIRERLRHAEEMARLHEKTEQILDNVPTGIMTLSETGRITALNRTLRECVSEEVIGRQVSEAFPLASAETRSQLKALLDDARASARVKSMLCERMHLLGKDGQCSVRAVPLEPRYPEARELLVIEDVTELHLLTSQLLQAEKLATVGVLAAGIAHEIGTPLGIVRARAELLSTKLGPDHAQTPGALVIVEQIDRVTRTVRQLLDFSRPQPAQVGAVSIAMAANAVIELLRFEAEPRKVSLHLEASESIPRLAANSDQLQQVLVNLVMNACDACSVDGKVTIRARAGDESDDRVRIEVIDNGCGVAEELRHQVFDPFFTTKKRGRGTGLGLTIAAQIVRGHGGQIDLESDHGRGTRVVVLWPTKFNPDEVTRGFVN